MTTSSKLITALHLLQKKEIPFAVYKHPESNEVCIVAQVKPVHLVHNVKEICYSSGFLIFPFESATTGVGYFINSDLLACDDKSLEKFIHKVGNIPDKSSKTEKTETDELSKSEYLKVAQKLIKKMKAGELQKVVLSRLKVVKPGSGFDPASFFLRLVKQYPDTFVYLFSIPETGMWIGATPEILLSQKSGNDVVIMSLAGTAPYPSNGVVQWGDKEIVEQQYVSDFIRERLLRLGIDNFEESPPKTVRAGHLAHIQTIFKVSGLDKHSHIDKLLKELHPTPAVCGLPQRDAYKLIDSVEPHGRKFYTGFLGPWLLNGKSDLYVNLRCAEINDDTLNLYVGGGLTAESDPEKEWQETELKAQTLLSVVDGK